MFLSLLYSSQAVSEVSPVQDLRFIMSTEITNPPEDIVQQQICGADTEANLEFLRVAGLSISTRQPARHAIESR